MAHHSHSVQGILHDLTHPKFSHLSNEAKDVLKDFYPIEREYNQSSRKRQISDSLDKTDVRRVLRVVCMGLGGIATYRTSHPQNYKKVLWQLAELKFFCEYFHGGHKALSLKAFKVGVFDFAFGDPVDLQVIRHVLDAFSHDVARAYPEASQEVKSDTFWYTPGMDLQGVTPRWNGGGAPFICTWCLRYLTLEMDADESKEAHEHLDALDAEIKTNYKESFTPDWSGLPEDAKWAFRNSQLFEKK